MSNLTEQQELNKLIEDRFNLLDKKLDNQLNEVKIEIVKVDAKLTQKISDLDSKFTQEITKLDSKLTHEISKFEFNLGQEIATLKVDVNWIKWLFGGLLSFILILLSVLITLLFKLVGVLASS